MFALAETLQLDRNFVVAPATPYFSLSAETTAEEQAREALLDVAMGAGRRRKASEAIRRGRLPAEGLALCAHDARGSLVGTVRLWNIAAGKAGGQDVAALLLGPLAVAPSHEGIGIGSALMRRAVAEATWRGHGAIVLVGDPDYYGRFGFCAKAAEGLSMPGPFERHRMLGLDLKSSWLAGAEGLVRATGRKPKPADAAATG